MRNFGRVVKALALGASLARGTGSNPVGCMRPFNLVDLRHLNLPAAPRVGLAAADLCCSTYTSAGTSPAKKKRGGEGVRGGLGPPAARFLGGLMIGDDVHVLGLEVVDG